MELTVQVSGVPPPVVQWFRRDEEIVDDEPKTLVSIVDEFGLATLILNDVQAEHGGDISCVATNDVGRTTTAAFLSVEGGSPLS